MTAIINFQSVMLTFVFFVGLAYLWIIGLLYIPFHSISSFYDRYVQLKEDPYPSPIHLILS